MIPTCYYKNIYGINIPVISLRNSTLATLIIFIIASPIVFTSSSFAFHTQYNLPLPSPLEHQPSYAIRIPFGSLESNVGYDPANASIPAGMTAVWFNDDSTQHTVTTLTNESKEEGLSPFPIPDPILEPAVTNIANGIELFDSGVLPPGFVDVSYPIFESEISYYYHYTVAFIRNRSL